MLKKSSESLSKKPNFEFQVSIWDSVVEFNMNLDAQFTTKANFLFAASTLILVFFLNRVFSSEFLNLPTGAKAGIIIIVLGAFASSLASILIVVPKLRIFSKKMRSSKDVFYYKNILKFYSREKYVDYLINLPTDKKRMGEAYAHQIYSLASNCLPYKARLLKISGWVLILSVFLSVIFFIIYFV